MAKLEIRDLDHEVELKEHELAEIKGGATPITIPRVLNQTSLYGNVWTKPLTFATPIEIP